MSCPTRKVDASGRSQLRGDTSVSPCGNVFFARPTRRNRGGQTAERLPQALLWFSDIDLYIYIT